MNETSSAVFGPAIALQVRLVEALAETPGFVTFIPARFSIPLQEHDLPYLPFMAPCLETEQCAKERGVGLTRVWAGAFDYSFFQYGGMGTSILENKVEANSTHLRTRLPIT